MNARDNTPLRTRIADRLAAGEDTAAGIASAIGKGDTPSIVVKELNAMRTDGQVECEQRGKKKELVYWLAVPLAVAADDYEPEWLQPLKNEWLSASKLSKIFHKAAGGSFLSWFNGVKSRCRKVSIPCKSGASDVSTHYLVKHVWAMAQAHDVTLLPTPVSSPAKFIEMLQKENEHLRNVAASAAHLLDIERKAHQETRRQVDDILPKKSVTALLVKAHEPRPIAGVYFLVCDDEIVYVGQSKNVLSRMSGHAGKRFNTVKMIPVCEEGLLATERMMIKILKPRYNRVHNGEVEDKPSKEAAKV